MSNLRLINKTEISSAVNSLSISDVFTDDYDIYQIEITNVGMTNGGGDYLFGRLLNTSGSLITASNYEYASQYLPSSTSTTAAEVGGNKTEWESFCFVGDGTNDTINLTMYIYNPTDPNSFTFYTTQASSHRASTGINYMFRSVGCIEQAIDITGIEFSAKTGNMDSGTFEIYGLRVD